MFLGKAIFYLAFPEVLVKLVANNFGFVINNEIFLTFLAFSAFIIIFSADIGIADYDFLDFPLLELINEFIISNRLRPLPLLEDKHHGNYQYSKENEIKRPAPVWYGTFVHTADSILFKPSF